MHFSHLWNWPFTLCGSPESSRFPCKIGGRERGKRLELMRECVHTEATIAGSLQCAGTVFTNDAVLTGGISDI